jgi:hypothetical protein
VDPIRRRKPTEPFSFTMSPPNGSLSDQRGVLVEGYKFAALNGLPAALGGLQLTGGSGPIQCNVLARCCARSVCFAALAFVAVAALPCCVSLGCEATVD